MVLDRQIDRQIENQFIVLRSNGYIQNKIDGVTDVVSAEVNFNLARKLLIDINRTLIYNTDFFFNPTTGKK